MGEERAITIEPPHLFICRIADTDSSEPHKENLKYFITSYVWPDPPTAATHTLGPHSPPQTKLEIIDASWHSGSIETGPYILIDCNRITEPTWDTTMPWYIPYCVIIRKSLHFALHQSKPVLWQARECGVLDLKPGAGRARFNITNFLIIAEIPLAMKSF